MSDILQKELRNQWEQRANHQGNTCSGVLFKNFPVDFNQYLHEWHAQIILSQLLPLLPQQASLLDLGCGYGRMSALIHAARPDIKIIGLDFAFAYCKLYQSNLTRNPIICADVSQLPFQEGRFDAVISITTLMYVPEDRRVAVTKTILQLVKPRGLVLFIDPGLEFSKLVTIFKKSHSLTSGQGFYLSTYENLGKSSLSRIIGSGGLFGFTFLLPILYLFRQHRWLRQNLFKLSKWLDKKFSNWRKFSLHRWMLLEKNDLDN